MDVREAARRWARTWERSWREHDPDLLRTVYAADCAFWSSPFRPPQPPWEYAAWAFSDEQAGEPSFGEPLVDGDRAVVPWSAQVVNADTTEQTLAGSSHLRFDPEGLVVEERDYWNAADGPAPPFAGRGRPAG